MAKAGINIPMANGMTDSNCQRPIPCLGNPGQLSASTDGEGWFCVLLFGDLQQADGEKNVKPKVNLACAQRRVLPG
jgi:hypothetical protein